MLINFEKRFCYFFIVFIFSKKVEVKLNIYIFKEIIFLSRCSWLVVGKGSINGRSCWSYWIVVV